MLIGITGTDGSGKGRVVEYLVKEKNFAHYSSRALLLTEMSKRGIEGTRTNMRLVANELRKTYGNDYLVRYYLEKATSEGSKNAIIESIRATAEAETLKAHGGILISVDADQNLRYKRVQERRSESDKVSFEEFQKHEELETHDPDPYGMQKQKVMAMAHYTIRNDGSVEELHDQIENILGRIMEDRG